MEENTNPSTTDKNSDSKKKYVSMEEWIERMKLVFTNAKLPSVLPVLQTVGYTGEKLDASYQKTLELEKLCRTQKLEYAQQYAETARFDNKVAETNATFLKHRGLAKIRFRSDLQIQSILNLNKPSKTAYSEWTQLVLNFYSQLSNSAELKAAVASTGITDTDIATALDKLQEVQTLKESQKKETAEAQSATETRDKAFDALYEEYAELLQYAKVLMGEKQALEALAIVVKR